MAEPMTTLGSLNLIAELLNAATHSIAKLGDSIAHIVSLGTKGYDAASARHIRARLKDISARLVYLYRLPNASIFSGLEGYIEQARKTGNKKDLALRVRWAEYVRTIVFPLQQIQELLDDISNERSDFVLEKSYGDLLETLNSRVNIIQEIMRLPAPTSPEEIKALQEVASKYHVLRENLNAVLVEFLNYLKQL
jgi:hypothetical protein